MNESCWRWTYGIACQDDELLCPLNYQTSEVMMLSLPHFVFLINLEDEETYWEKVDLHIQSHGLA